MPELKNDVNTSLRPLVVRGGPFAKKDFIGDEENFEILAEMKILIVGAGGLGCELLKNAALSGLKDIVLIDLDTIDVSNLNRQFLFRSGDENKSKAEVAAARIMEVVPDCKVKWYKDKIQDFGTSWYANFDVVIAGLDNQEARKWLNQTLCDLVKFDADGQVVDDSVIPLIDGGTEGFMGQSRIFFPHKGSCFECQLVSDAGGPDVHMCTPAVNPRVPEHCAMYALLFQWEQLCEFKSATDYKLWTRDDKENPTPVKLDKDNAHHMTWLYNRANEWAVKHEIQGLTYSLTQQVVKNIIPAIAATNATIAASCINEALKYLTFGASNLDNYFQYNGRSTSFGTYARTFVYHRNMKCEACTPPLMLNLPTGATGQSFLEAAHVLFREEEKKKGWKDRGTIKIVEKGGLIKYSSKNEASHGFLGSLSAYFTTDEETGEYIPDLLTVITSNNIKLKVFVFLAKAA